jgi:raffinose/stachyose/melibiose transport system permease protein|tara:strand:- start:385 stop:1236 length:852 start_codon:yes stop_codon:yes gene_type:complete
MNKYLNFIAEKNQVRYLVISIVFLIFSFFWIYPLLWVLSASLKTDFEIWSGLGLIPDRLVWENFERAWIGANMGRYFFNTLIITVVSVIIVVVTTGMFGYVIGRYSFPGKKILIGILISTIFIPQGYTIIPVFDLLSDLNLSKNLLGLIIATAGASPVIYILLFAGYFSRIPVELEEAAKMDGAGFFRIFVLIMLPLTKPVVATVSILQVLHAWNDFLLPVVITLGNPDIRTLSVGVYAFKGEYFIDWSGMAAASVITILPIIVLFLFMQKYFVEGVQGAVKG